MLPGGTVPLGWATSLDDPHPANAPTIASPLATAKIRRISSLSSPSGPLACAAQPRSTAGHATAPSSSPPVTRGPTPPGRSGATPTGSGPGGPRTWTGHEPRQGEPRPQTPRSLALALGGVLLGLVVLVVVFVVALPRPHRTGHGRGQARHRHLHRRPGPPQSRVHRRRWAVPLLRRRQRAARHLRPAPGRRPPDRLVVVRGPPPGRRPRLLAALERESEQFVDPCNGPDRPRGRRGPRPVPGRGHRPAETVVVDFNADSPTRAPPRRPSPPNRRRPARSW